MRTKDFEFARREIEEAISIGVKLLKRNTLSLKLGSELGYCYELKTRILRDQQKYAESLGSAKEYNKISQDLLKRYPKSQSVHWSHAVSLEYLSTAYFSLNEEKLGFECIIRSLDCWKNLFTLAPQNQNVSRATSICARILATRYFNSGNNKLAYKYQSEAITFLNKSKQKAGYAERLNLLEFNLSKYRLIDYKISKEKQNEAGKKALIAARHYWKQAYSKAYEIYKTTISDSNLRKFQSRFHSYFAAASAAYLHQQNPDKNILLRDSLRFLNLYLREIERRKHPAISNVFDYVRNRDPAFKTFRNDPEFQRLFSKKGGN